MSKFFLNIFINKVLGYRAVNWILDFVSLVVCFIAIFLPVKILVYYLRPLEFLQEYVREVKDEK